MDVLAHVLVPLVCLLAARVPARRALMLAPLGALADVDALLGPHRALAHNVWAVALVALVAWALARRRLDDAPRFAALAAFAYGSHMLLDLPYGVALLWPLTPAALLVRPEVLVDMGGALPVFLPKLTLLLLPHAPQFADPPLFAPLAPPVFELFGSGAFAIAWTLLAALAIEKPWSRARRVAVRGANRRETVSVASVATKR